MASSPPTNPATPGTARPHHLAFREDINGLRALAVTAVIVFHFSLLRGVYGGFVGVDVFFVVSGFLMTSIIQKDVDRGRFSVWSFYAARVKRIVPALLALCLALLVFGYVAMDPMAYLDLAQSVLSSLLFVSNVHYLLTTDYFASLTRDNWLLHTWSLSVEWQFYIFYPLVLAPILRLAVLRRHAQLLIWIALVLSLAASALLTYLKPDHAFYLLPTRAWEFLAGATVALAASGDLRQRMSPLQPFLVPVGLAMILLSMVVFDSLSAWPSYRAMLPVAGTALVILAARTDAWWARNRLVRRVGLWSYSLYLWHWPFVVGLRYFYPDTSGVRIAAALGLTVVCAALSYALVERPVASQKIAPRLVLRVVAVAFVATLVLALADRQTDGFANRVGAPGWLGRYEAAAMDGDYPAACGGLTRGGGAMRLCELGRAAPASKAERTLVIGDSFAQLWWGGFQDLVAEDPGRAATFATFGGCPVLPTAPRIRAGAKCAAFLQKAYQLAETGQYGSIVIASIWLPSLQLAYGEQGPNRDALCFGPACSVPRSEAELQAALDTAFVALGDEVAKLRAGGARVILVLPPPFGGTHVPRQMVKTAFWNGGRAERLWIDAADYDRRVHYLHEQLLAIAQRTGAEVVDPRLLTCDALRCATSTPAGEPLYSDSVHWRSSFVRHSGFIQHVMTRTRVESDAAALLAP